MLLIYLGVQKLPRTAHQFLLTHNAQLASGARPVPAQSTYISSFSKYTRTPKTPTELTIIILVGLSICLGQFQTSETRVRGES